MPSTWRLKAALRLEGDIPLALLRSIEVGTHVLKLAEHLRNRQHVCAIKMTKRKVSFTTTPASTGI